MDCVAGFVLIPGCWIVWMGCVDSGCVDLGLFFWFSAGGLCGFRCNTGVDCGCGSVAAWVKK